MRKVFISLFISVAVAMIGVGIIAPILPLYANTFAASGTSVGIVFAAFSLSRALLGPFLGRVSDRIGRKRMLIFGLAGYAVVSILYVAANSLWQLGLFRLLQGAASVMITPIAQAYIGDITPSGKEGRYMNLFYSSMFLGMAIGPMLGGELSELWSYQMAFYAMGTLSLVALILITATLPADDSKSKHHRKPASDIVPIRELMKNDAVKAICVYMATRGFWRQGFNTFYPLFAAATSGLGEGSVGIILSVYMFGGGLLQIPFGFLADRYPKFPQIIIGSTLAPLLLLLVPFVHSVWGVALIMFGIGGLSALSRASILVIRTELGREYGMGTMTGLYGGAFAVGQMLGPVTCGVMVDLVGLRGVFPFGSAVGLLGTGFVISRFRRWKNTCSA